MAAPWPMGDVIENAALEPEGGGSRRCLDVAEKCISSTPIYLLSCVKGPCMEPIYGRDSPSHRSVHPVGWLLRSPARADLPDRDRPTQRCDQPSSKDAGCSVHGLRRPASPSIRDLRPVDICTQPFPGSPQTCRLLISLLIHAPAGGGEHLQKRLQHWPIISYLHCRVAVSSQRQHRLVEGVPQLSGAPVKGTELRASAAMSWRPAREAPPPCRAFATRSGYSDLEGSSSTVVRAADLSLCYLSMAR